MSRPLHSPPLSPPPSASPSPQPPAPGSPESPAPPAPHLPARRFERLLGRPPRAWTADDLVDLYRDQGMRLVSLMHIGGDGWLKTLDFAPRSESHLRDIFAAGERADGSSLFAGSGIPVEASDVVLRPRLETAFHDPFAQQPTMALLCAHLGRDGAPLPQSPDTILRKAYERLRHETGIELHALGEVEYFLGKRAEETDIYGADDRGYHATAPFVFGQALRRQAMVHLVETGVPVKYGHSEAGYIEADEAEGVIWEQHEIELNLRPLADSAEGISMTQWMVRQLAHRRGMRCSFEPIVREGHAGSGLHVHLSPVRDGAHLPTIDDRDVLTDEARWLIGGLVTMGGALMAFGNRSARSFTRLRQGKEAPRAVSWGRFNRHALVRLPIQVVTADGRAVTPPTIEFRLPDGSANPYLLLTGIVQAMLAAREFVDLETLIERSRVLAGGPPSAIESTPVPRDPFEIAAALDEHRDALERGEVFPPGFMDATLAALRSGG